MYHVELILKKKIIVQVLDSYLKVYVNFDVGMTSNEPSISTSYKCTATDFFFKKKIDVSFQNYSN